MLKVKTINLFYESEKLKNNLEKIDPANIIKEALSLGETNIRQLSDDKEETLNLIYNKTIKSYLEHLNKYSINEAHKKLESELEKNKKSIKSLLIKSENEINEYKKKFSFLYEENENLKEKIFSLQNNNRELKEQIKTSQMNFEKLQNYYQNISQQKALFEEMVNSYPGKNPSEVIKELDNMKDGIVQMLKDYQNISLKLNEEKEKKKKFEDEYKASIQKLSFENKIIKEEKDSMDYKYYNKINNLELHLADNESKAKDNISLKNALFHIYNLLFKEFALNRNLKIDNKYLNVKESDFNANFFYDNEIKNYIKLMIKTMNPITYDIMFRETMGYLNMILRVYLPSKFGLRFQPVKAFKEIKDFIDQKMCIIDNNQKIIENYKKEIENLKNEIFQLKQKLEYLNKEYNSYKKIVEKEFIKTNRIIFQLKNNKEKEINNKTINNFYNLDNRPNLSFSRKKNEKSDKFLFNDSDKGIKFNKLSHIPFKKKKKKSQLINPKIKLESNYVNEKIINNKNNTYKTLDNLKNNERAFNDFLSIKKSPNGDKIIKNHGNQEYIDSLNNIKFLINETNRLFLYQPKMNYTRDRMFNEKNNILKSRVIKEYKDIKMSDEEKINNKIIKQINNLIISSSK